MLCQPMHQNHSLVNLPRLEKQLKGINTLQVGPYYRLVYYEHASRQSDHLLTLDTAETAFVYKNRGR